MRGGTPLTLLRLSSASLALESASLLEPKMFGPPYLYAPSQDLPENTDEACLRSTKCSPSLAAWVCNWFILKITCVAEQVVEAFKADRITISYVQTQRSWRLYGDLSFGEMPFVRYELDAAPAGVQARAEMRLTRT